MNTTKVPQPIMREEYVRNGDGSHVTVSAPSSGDHFNLSTGEVTASWRSALSLVTLLGARGVRCLSRRP
jgi:hypothetical protein